MKVRLELVHKRAKVKKVWLKADTIIGRSTECGLRIASNEVSRQHCKICLSEEGVTVRDLGSSNGTFVNGYQLEPETDYEIAPDSELSLGGIKFFVRFKEPAGKNGESDGLGSTVDLKPGVHPFPEQTKITARKAEPPAEPETFPEPETAEPLPLSETGTVQMARPRNDIADDRDVGLSTHGDSAILERDEEPAGEDLIGEENVESEPGEPALPAVEVDLELDEEPETTEVPNSLLMQEIQKAASAGQQAPSPSDEAEVPLAAGGGEPDDSEVAEFLKHVAEEEPAEEPGEEESLGDFFKQFE